MSAGARVIGRCPECGDPVTAVTLDAGVRGRRPVSIGGRPVSLAQPCGCQVEVELGPGGVVLS